MADVTPKKRGATRNPAAQNERCQTKHPQARQGQDTLASQQHKLQSTFANLFQVIRAFLRAHLFGWQDALQRGIFQALKRPVYTIITLLTLTTSLFFPGLMMLMDNNQQLLPWMHAQETRVNLFMQNDSTKIERENILDQAKSIAQITQATWISPAFALDQMREAYQLDITQSPTPPKNLALPYTLELSISLADTRVSQLKDQVLALSQHPKVIGIDGHWQRASSLEYLFSILWQISYVLAAIMLSISGLAIYQMVISDLDSHLHEIRLNRLLGASIIFIARRLLVTSLCLVTFAGLGALLLVHLLFLSLHQWQASAALPQTAEEPALFTQAALIPLDLIQQGCFLTIAQGLAVFITLVAAQGKLKAMEAEGLY